MEEKKCKREEVMEMLEGILDMAQNDGAEIEIKVVRPSGEREVNEGCRTDDNVQRESAEKDGERAEANLDEAADKLATDMAIAAVCMGDAKSLSDTVESIYYSEGQKGMDSVNRFLDYCAKDNMVRLQVEKK